MTDQPSDTAAKPVRRRAATKTAAKTAAQPAPKKKAATKTAKEPKAKAAPKLVKKLPAAPAKAKPAPDPSDQLAELAIAALDDLKGVDIKRLDVRGLTTITDVMVIATGTSNRHASSLAHSVIDKAKQAGTRPIGVEGLNEGEWVLVNLGGVIVHVMQAQARAFYQLEKLWDFGAREPLAQSA